MDEAFDALVLFLRLSLGKFITSWQTDCESFFSALVSSIISIKIAMPNAPVKVTCLVRVDFIVAYCSFAVGGVFFWYSLLGNGVLIRVVEEHSSLEEADFSGEFRFMSSLLVHGSSSVWNSISLVGAFCGGFPSVLFPVGLAWCFFGISCVVWPCFSSFFSFMSIASSLNIGFRGGYGCSLSKNVKNVLF